MHTRFASPSETWRTINIYFLLVELGGARRRAGWDKMTDAQLLGSLKTAEATVEATRKVTQAEIDEWRKREVSWDAIGTALGLSRQVAWERFSQLNAAAAGGIEGRAPTDATPSSPA